QSAQKSQETQTNQSPQAPAAEKKQTPFDESQLKGKKAAMIETKYGKIYIELFPKEAPETVKNFEKLAKSGYYNGKTFHRVEPGFVVQGGAPNPNGSGSLGYGIPEELNWHKHLKGALGMATQGTNTNTGDAQFYIALADLPQLDGGYTVFGQTLSGMDAVEQIQIGDIMTKVTVKDYK
ncbi:MAG: peptidylprolyl isomerase, partial [Eubacteriales bacterium]